MKNSKAGRVELLAPAGNKEAFYGAIKAGADAIYLGGTRFGARAYADNFTEEDLVECIRYAHLFGRKVYMTVNTLMRNEEMDELYDYLLPYYEAGLDAVIIQDIGVFTQIRNRFPGLGLHVSTQMTITGAYGAKTLAKMGAERIVPARELSLTEVRKIKEETGLSLECFIHGAMCYCYSGQCLFSSILGGRSGNRGRCAQPCRLPYKIGGMIQTGECYPLSLKDMCTLEFIPQLIEAGIDSFKIEGRMKKPEYAAGVTAIYRKYIDRYYETGSIKIEEDDLKTLFGLYMRSESQTGYYEKHNGREMITLHDPSYNSADESRLSMVRAKYLDKLLKLPVNIYGTFLKDYPASVIMQYDDLTVEVSGDVVSAAMKAPITHENVEKQLTKLGGNHFTSADVQITMDEDCFFPLKAINELRREAVRQLEDAIIEKNGLPAKRYAEEVSEAAGEDVSRGIVTEKSEIITSGDAMNIDRSVTPGIIISVNTYEQLNVLKNILTEGDYEAAEKLSRVYVNADLLLTKQLKPDKGVLAVCEELAKYTEVVLALPYILRLRDQSYLKALAGLASEKADIIKGFLVRSAECIGFIKENKLLGKLYGDAGFYHWNHETAEAWESTVDGFTLPYELNAAQQRSLLASVDQNCEKVFYGRIPMMVTANCIAKTGKGCILGDEAAKEKAKSGELYLIDRYNVRFPAVPVCAHCYNIIYNSVPLSLHGDVSKWINKCSVRLDFTLESADETEMILQYFGSVYMTGGASMPLPYKDYTAGHEKRGAE